MGPSKATEMKRRSFAQEDRSELVPRTQKQPHVGLLSPVNRLHQLPSCCRSGRKSRGPPAPEPCDWHGPPGGTHAPPSRQPGHPHRSSEATDRCSIVSRTRLFLQQLVHQPGLVVQGQDNAHLIEQANPFYLLRLARVAPGHNWSAKPLGVAQSVAQLCLTHRHRLSWLQPHHPSVHL